MEIKSESEFFFIVFNHIFFNFPLRKQLLNESHTWNHHFSTVPAHWQSFSLSCCSIDFRSCSFIDRTVQNVHVSTARICLHSSLWHFIRSVMTNVSKPPKKKKQLILQSANKYKHERNHQCWRWRLKQQTIHGGNTQHQTSQIKIIILSLIWLFCTFYNTQFMFLYGFNHFRF